MGYGCAREGYPTMYTNIADSEIKDFIREHTGVWLVDVHLNIQIIVKNHILISLVYFLKKNLSWRPVAKVLIKK